MIHREYPSIDSYRHLDIRKFLKKNKKEKKSNLIRVQAAYYKYLPVHPLSFILLFLPSAVLEDCLSAQL
jgi:hypothetical protein